MNDVQKVQRARRHLHAVGECPVIEMQRKFGLNKAQIYATFEAAGHLPAEYVAVFLPALHDRMTRMEVCRLMDVDYRPPIVGKVE